MKIKILTKLVSVLCAAVMATSCMAMPVGAANPSAVVEYNKLVENANEQDSDMLKIMASNLRDLVDREVIINNNNHWSELLFLSRVADGWVELANNLVPDNAADVNSEQLGFSPVNNLLRRIKYVGRDMKILHVLQRRCSMNLSEYIDNLYRIFTNFQMQLGVLKGKISVDEIIDFNVALAQASELGIAETDFLFQEDGFWNAVGVAKFLQDDILNSEQGSTPTPIPDPMPDPTPMPAPADVDPTKYDEDYAIAEQLAEIGMSNEEIADAEEAQEGQAKELAAVVQEGLYPNLVNNAPANAKNDESYAVGAQLEEVGMSAEEVANVEVAEAGLAKVAAKEVQLEKISGSDNKAPESKDNSGENGLVVVNAVEDSGFTIVK